MTPTNAAIKRLLEAPGVQTLTLGPIEEDGSLGIKVEYLTEDGRGVLTMFLATAADDVTTIAARLNEIVDNNELDPLYNAGYVDAAGSNR